MGDRDEILAALPASRGSVRPSLSAERLAVEGDLWDVFAARLSELGGRMAVLPEVSALDPTHCYVEPAAQSMLGWGKAGDVWSAEVGITTGLAIAESGSVLLTAGMGSARMASLAPRLHIVLVRESDIVRSIEDVFPILPEATSVIVTGTSRTADIEGVLVRGVHGPQSVWAVRVSH